MNEMNEPDNRPLPGDHWHQLAALLNEMEKSGLSLNVGDFGALAYGSRFIPKPAIYAANRADHTMAAWDVKSNRWVVERDPSK